MGDVAFTLVFGFAFIGLGLLTLRAKSLIFPGYQSFGMSEDACWSLQRASGWLATGWGALIVVFAVVSAIQAVMG